MPRREPDEREWQTRKRRIDPQLEAQGWQVVPADALPPAEPQTILAKAFRGELVPAEAELARREGRPYEPASTHLERIKAERETAGDKSKAKRWTRTKRTKAGEVAEDDGRQPVAVPDAEPAAAKAEQLRMFEPSQPEPAARPDRRSIDDVDTDEVMAAFRQAYRGRGKMPEDELLHATADQLGFQRLGKSIKQRLKGHLRAAIRRKILVRQGDIIELETFRMDEYTTDELVDVVETVMAKGRDYERDEVIVAVAHHLGFTRLRDTVVTPIKSAINAAIRRNVVEYEGSTIWRER